MAYSGIEVAFLSSALPVRLARTGELPLAGSRLLAWKLKHLTRHIEM